VDIAEVAQDVYRFEVPLEGQFYGSVVYLIRERQGTVIEPGPGAAIPSIQEAMSRLGMADLAYVIPTHIHMDHGGGAGALARLFPASTVLVHPRGAKHMIDPTRLIEGTKMVWGEDFERHSGPILPVPEAQLKIAEDGEVIRLDGRELQLIHAPGHAPHQMVVFDRTAKGLFCGEALGMPGHQLPGIVPGNFDLQAYLATVARIRGLGARRLFYSHGGVEDRADEIILRAEDNVRRYGDMVLDALKRGERVEDMGLTVGQDLHARLGIEVDQGQLDMTVMGYAAYFQSQGVV